MGKAAVCNYVQANSIMAGTCSGLLHLSVCGPVWKVPCRVQNILSRFGVHLVGYIEEARRKLATVCIIKLNVANHGKLFVFKEF